MFSLKLLIVSLTLQVLNSSKLRNIVGSRDVAECEQPYIVNIFITKPDDNYHCAGSIVDNSHIVTAAHCVSGDVKYVHILYGSVSKLRFVSLLRTPHYAVHKDFQKTDYNILNDVAVLTLSTPLYFNDCLQPIQLASEGQTFVGDCLISGWGKTSAYGKVPDVLQTAEVPLMNNSKCATYVAVKEQQVCAGTGKFNSEAICQGDSGGPLICTSATDGNKVLVGIASFGWTCTEGVSVFTRVSYFKNWIEEHLRRLD